MRLVWFPPNDEDTAVQQLPEPDLVVDPRPVGRDGYVEFGYKFKVTLNGTTMTITRTDPPENRARRKYKTGWIWGIRFRVYNSNEDRYSFESTMYIYHGLEDENAPLDSTEIIIKDGVKTIGEYAFYGCESLVKVTIPDSVKRIEECAFEYCTSLRFIQLPPNLQYIEDRAFAECSSLEAVYLPSTVTQIGYEAFYECRSLRILYIPDNVEHIGDLLDGLDYCEKILTDEVKEVNIEWLQNRYNPLHNLCCQPFVTPQAITQHIQDNNNEERSRTNDLPQFTALHLLLANPSVTGDMVTAYLQLAPDVAVMQDDIGMTPLHMLCSRPYFSNCARDAIRTYLALKEGKEAAFMMDNQGKTPFQYLCEKTFGEMPFLKEDNKSFGGLFCWWFDCLDISVFVEDADAEENTEKRKLSGGDDL